MTSAPSRLPRLLTVNAAAEQLDVCTKTIRRWIKSGALHAHRLGRQQRISEDDLLLFIQKRRQ